ncbi:hypothetical protein F2Q69_00055805 [Brassica cretica]|uniref:Uncharacterized protein n=1 Tax=Brassica cretica TaxID=69181 RepID=A0A8S9MS82_BRACR|nr:hypothetical protein F2Q69_00055805 [Brassica cretica]
MQNATNCYGDTGRMTTKHDSLHRGHGIKCEDMGSKRNRITLWRLASAPCSREVRSGDISALSGVLARLWSAFRFGFPGLRFVAISDRWCRSRILLLRSRVISLSYAGGDGGSSLFQHVGDTRKACKVVVYGSSAAARRPSSLWTSTALSLYGSSGLEAFCMEFSGEHKPDSCIVRCWRKLYMPVLGFLLSYSGSDTGSLGILENKVNFTFCDFANCWE